MSKIVLPTFASLGANGIVALKLQNAGAATLQGGVTIVQRSLTSLYALAVDVLIVLEPTVREKTISTSTAKA